MFSGRFGLLSLVKILLLSVMAGVLLAFTRFGMSIGETLLSFLALVAFIAIVAILLMLM